MSTLFLRSIKKLSYSQLLLSKWVFRMYLVCIPLFTLFVNFGDMLIPDIKCNYFSLIPMTWFVHIPSHHFVYLSQFIWIYFIKGRITVYQPNNNLKYYQFRRKYLILLENSHLDWMYFKAEMLHRVILLWSTAISTDTFRNPNQLLTLLYLEKSQSDVFSERRGENSF